MDHLRDKTMPSMPCTLNPHLHPYRTKTRWSEPYNIDGSLDQGVLDENRCFEELPKEGTHVYISKWK